MAASQDLSLLMIVEDPAIAQFAADSGVDKLFVDLEIMGKAERQGHLDTVQSVQTVDTVARIREVVPDKHLLVRINPMHDGSKSEIDAVLDRGADSIMLPMFHDRDTLARFFDLLAARAEALPLFETVGALQALPSMVGDLPLTGLHFGLNDLHLERGDPMMFTPLAAGVLDASAIALSEAAVPFGIGGVARAGEGKVPPELLLGEHARLGSTGAILSRSFHRRAASLEALTANMDFAHEIGKLLKIYREFQSADPVALTENHARFLRAVETA
ncbi:hypothetical protein [Roseobacter sp. A03A-229]